MLGDLVIFGCLFTLMIAFFRRRSHLTHITYGNGLIRAGLILLVLASLSDVLFIGKVALFDIGLSSDDALQALTLIVYAPGILAVAVGLWRLLPAISQINVEIAARRESEARQIEQNARLKQAIARAEAAERTLADAIESMTDAVAIFDADDKLLTINEAYAALCSDIRDELKPGLSYERILRTRVALGVFPEAVGREEEWLNEQFERRRTGGGPTEVETEDGRVIRARDNRTRLGGLVSIRTDVTETREREKALKDSRAKLEQAQSIAHIGNWMHNSNAGRHEWSDEIFRILGYILGEVEPSYKNFMTCVHEEDAARLKTVFVLASDKCVPFEVDFRIVRPQGKLIYARLIGRLDFDAKGQVQGASGTLQDITAQHLFEQELTQAKLRAEEGTRSKSLFLANMSHELRTPLNAVIGFSEVLAKEIYGPIKNDKYREYADNIQSSGTHLLSLIDDILDYSRLESGSVELQEAAFNLFTLARATQTMLAAKAIEKSTKISISESLDVGL
ncbi:MAG: PAS domain S-box protein, partial [Alphaproteobacteria bacterium]